MLIRGDEIEFSQFFFVVFSNHLTVCISRLFVSSARIRSLGIYTAVPHTIPRLQLLPANMQQFMVRHRCFNSFFYKIHSKCVREPHFSQSSLLLATTSQRTNKTESLPDLDTVQFSTDSPTLIVGEKYPIYLFNGMVAMLNCLAARNDELIVNDLLKNCMNDVLFDYLKRLSHGFNANVRRNWFVRNELSFVVHLLRLRNALTVVDNATVQKIAFHVMGCCTENELEDLLFILKSIVFNVTAYDQVADVFQTDMDKWYRSYVPLLGPMAQQINSLVHNSQSDFLIPNDWFWQPLLIFLNGDQRTDGKGLAKHSFITSLAERDIIETTIKFTALQKRNSLNFVTPTEELMFLMIAFMGPETTFLEPDICALLTDAVQQFFKENASTTFRFDEKFDGKSKFENLYVLFLDHFAGTSYGNESFSALAMVPLAQKYDDKWRKMVWSEHAVALRFITCREDQCVGSFDSYLFPIESDKSLLKAYYQALNGILREGSLPYKIARHHLDRNQIATKK